MYVAADIDAADDGGGGGIHWNCDAKFHHLIRTHDGTVVFLNRKQYSENDTAALFNTLDVSFLE